MGTPDEEVAVRIINEIRKNKLLSENSIKRVAKGLASGKLTAEEWRLAFEMDAASKENKDASKG